MVFKVFFDVNELFKIVKFDFIKSFVINCLQDYLMNHQKKVFLVKKAVFSEKPSCTSVNENASKKVKIMSNLTFFRLLLTTEQKCVNENRKCVNETGFDVNEIILINHQKML